jgi:hypothetical protein
METVVANCKAKTGQTLAQWVTRARKERLKDAKAARSWARAQGLSVVYQSALLQALFPDANDDSAMLAAQYSGPKAALRPIFDRITAVAAELGDDVEVMPRRTQVTLSRTTSFAVVRAPTRDRIDVMLKLHGEKGTPRLVIVAKAGPSDPSHVVAIREESDVDDEVVAWLRRAYDRAR